MMTFLAPGLQVLGGVRPLGEAPGRLDHHVGAEVGPRQLGGIRLREHLDLAAVDADGAVRRLDARQRAVDRVVLEQVGQRPGVRDVVHGDDLDVGAGLVRGAEDVAADAAEAVDPDAYWHGLEPFVLAVVVRRARGYLSAVEHGVLPTPVRPRPVAGPGVRGATAARNPSQARLGGAVDVAVLDLDEVAAVRAEVRAQVLGDDDGAVAAARAADRDDEVRLPLGHVLREQVLQQRQRALVELGEATVARRRSRRSAGRSR